MSAGNIILAIEITNPGSGLGSVSLGRLVGDRVAQVDTEPVGAGGRSGGGFGGHDNDLMPAIGRVCGRAGISPRSGAIRRVAVSVGPGGYTSTRVACAAGKMIAEASGAECVSVPTSMVVLEAAGAEGRAGRVAIALAGKGESVWVQLFEDGVSAGKGRLVSGETAADVLRDVRMLIGDRYVPAAVRTAAERAGARIIDPVFDAGACARVGARLSPIDPADLVPIYPREPDAVTLWRAKKKG